MNKPLLIMTYGQSNADRHVTKPRLPSPLLEDLNVVTLTAGMGVRGCGYNDDGTRMDRKGEFTIDGRRVQPANLPPVLPAAYNETRGTSMLHVAGAMARTQTGAPVVGVRAAAKGGLRFVALPGREGIAGIYKLADGSISPILTLLAEEAAEIAAHLAEICGEAPSVVYILFVHGEADRSTPPGDYVREFNEARALITEGLAQRGLTPRWLITQAAGTSAAGDGNAWQSRLAVLDALSMDPDLVFVGPLYPYPLIDHVHYSSIGKALIGELSGLVIGLLERGHSWETPFLSHWRLDENIISIECATPEPLTFQQGLDHLDNYGFSIPVGPTIQRVTLDGPARLKIELDTIPDRKFFLDYAFRRTSRLHPEQVRNHCFAQGAVRTTWAHSSRAVDREILRKWLPGFRLHIDPRTQSAVQ